ncbi:MAG: Fe-S cluster assembly ATPase SufC [Patescibacteria group bacterium]
MLKLINLTIKAGDKTIIRDFSFEFEKDKVYAIMGPNGSGKSTLAMTIMGNPTYKVVGGRLQGIDSTGKSIDLNNLAPEERAEAGIFLSFQNPYSLSGVRVAQLLQLALKGKKSAIQIKKEIDVLCEVLGVSKELVGRSLNEGASGGEKKKLEIIQAAILGKSIQIFDEIDTGVDVDALKSISSYLSDNKKGKTFIVITHYNRILKYLKPDKVLVLKDGKLVKVGESELAMEIENHGYKI